MKHLDITRKRVEKAIRVLKVLDLIENDDTIVEMWNPALGITSIENSCDCECCRGRNHDGYGGQF